MKKNTELFDEILELARSYRADTTRLEYGFETRLMANLADLRASGMNELNEAGAFLTVFSSWLWRGVMGLTPVVVLIVFFCVLWFGISLPSDTHSLLNHVTGYLPYKPF